MDRQKKKITEWKKGNEQTEMSVWWHFSQPDIYHLDKTFFYSF